MSGQQLWLWLGLGLLAVVALAVRSFYVQFRGMCRHVREELTQLLRERRPEVTDVKEERGNLIVYTSDGARRLWEMADVYSEVARLPQLGADPHARRAIYEQALQTLFPPASGIDPALEVDPERIRPQLVTARAASALDGEVVRTPIPGLDLVSIYVRGAARAGRYVRESDLTALGLDRVSLHEQALENLRQGFPPEMLASAREESSGSAIQLGDGLDASRLLLIPEHLGNGDELVALAPHQDLLVLLPATSLREPEKLRQGLGMLRCPDHEPLLEQPIRVGREGFALV